MLNGLVSGEELYLLEIEGTYKRTIDRYVCNDFAMLQSTVQLLYGEAITSINYDEKETEYENIRSPYNIESSECNLQYDEANVHWYADGISQYLFIRSYPVGNLIGLEPSRLKNEIFGRMAKRPCIKEMEDCGNE